MNISILKKLFDIFKVEEEEQHGYILKEDDDIESYSNDRKLRQVSRHYEKSKIDAYNYDSKKMLRDKELNRQRKYRIKFDFLPSTQRSMNVRSWSEFIYQTFLKWSAIRNLIESLNGGVCCVCGKTSFHYEKMLIKKVKDENKKIDEHNKTSKSKKKRIGIEEGESYIFTDEEKNITTATECHEQWSFGKSNNRFVQKLEKLLPLCFVCHATHHINQHSNNEKYKKYLYQHYCTLNKVTIEQAKKDYNYCVDMRKENSEEKYLLDMSLINELKTECVINELFDPHTEAFGKFLSVNFKVDAND